MWLNTLLFGGAWSVCDDTPMRTPPPTPFPAPQHDARLAGQPVLRTQGETIALTLAALTIGCVGLYFASALVGPAFFALTLVLTVQPLVTWATAHRVPRVLAVLGAIVLIYAFVLGLFVALGVAVAQLVETLPAYSGKFQALWLQVLSLLDEFHIDQKALLDQASSVVSAGRIVELAQGLLSQVGSVGSLLMILALTVVFLLFDIARIEVRAASLARVKPGIVAALADFARAVRSYWLVSTVFGLIVAVLDTLALGALGVPMAVTWGVLSFITNYIPNVGFVLGLVPPVLLALVDSGPWTALWVVLAYSVLNFVIQTVIQPKFTGDAVGLNTTTTFLCLIFWSQVIGGLGTILAVPLTLFAKAVLIDSDPRARWVGAFLQASDTPVDTDRPDVPEELLEVDLTDEGVEAEDPARREQD